MLARRVLLLIALAGIAGASPAPTLTTRDRARAAILGACVADAASMGLHWIYSRNEIAWRMRERCRNSDDADCTRRLEFHAPPASPDYGSHTRYGSFYVNGSSSPYFDETLPLLRHVARAGSFDPAAFARESAAHVAAYGGYLNSVMRRFLAAERAGNAWPRSAVPHDTQAHALVKVPVLAARYAGITGELGARVAEAAAVHQRDAVPRDAAVFAAAVLERVILGETVEAAVVAEAHGGGSGAWARDALCMHGGADVGLAADPCGSSTASRGDMLGRDCTLPGALQLALHAALSPRGGLAGGGGRGGGGGRPSFADAVRGNIAAAGDSASRAIFLGALLGAAGGEAAIPEAFLNGVARARLAEVRELATRVADAREAALEEAHRHEGL